MTANSELSDDSRSDWRIVAPTAVLVVLLLRSAWVGDDAYITLRSVANFVGGYGLRWNVAERVQSYTHPLWMFVLSFGYWVTHEAFYTTIALSVITSVLATTCVATLLACNAWQASAAIIFLCLSRSFIEYSTSGLENPLSHLLLVLLVWSYTRQSSLRQIAMLASLLALNRLDASVLAAPLMAHSLFASWRNCGLRKTLSDAIIGASPLLLWEAFSLVYYGFPFPNTAYAKLNTGLPTRDLMRQGGVFLLHQIAWDPALAVGLFMGLGLAWRSGRLKDRLLGVGVVLYLFYVARIGGDFMMGRFTTLPFMACICLVAISAPPSSEGLANWISAIVAIAVIYVSPLGTESWKRAPGLNDERGGYRSAAGLLAATRNGRLPKHEWAAAGRRLRESGTQVAVGKPMGYLGFFAGPKVHIIDEFALTDPFLARLPAIANKNWTIGHFRRRLPDGYKETIETGVCRMTDRNLCEYYEALKLIAQGEIWSWKRFLAIIKMNTGAYERLIDRARYARPDPA